MSTDFVPSCFCCIRCNKPPAFFRQRYSAGITALFAELLRRFVFHFHKVSTVPKNEKEDSESDAFWTVRANLTVHGTPETAHRNFGAFLLKASAIAIGRDRRKPQSAMRYLTGLQY